MHSLYATVLGWFMTIVFGLALIPLWFVIGGSLFLGISGIIQQDPNAPRYFAGLLGITQIYGSDNVAGLALLVVFFMFLVGIGFIRLGMKFTLQRDEDAVKKYKDKIA